MTRRGLPARLAFWAVIAVVALGGAGGLWLVRGQAGAKTVAAQGPGPGGPPPAVPVEMGPVEIGTAINDATVVGTLRSNESVIIRPEIAGRLVEINVAEGDRIAKGALLFRLDDAIYRAELAEAEASFNLSRQNYQRARELYGRGAGTERARDEAFAKLEIDRASVELKKTRLSKTRVEAPFSGIVGLRKVSVGDYVQVGQDLVNIEDIDTIKADFRIPERYLAIVKDGQKARVDVDAYPDRAFEGAVYAIDPQIDPASRSIGIRARLPNPERLLRPGMYARATVVLEERQNAVIVPEQALMPRGNDRFVFKVVDGKTVLTKVEIGVRRAGKVEITRGLSAGDVVVTAGHLKIQDGTPVQAAAAAPKS